jgi:TolA-binding protein
MNSFWLKLTGVFVMCCLACAAWLTLRADSTSTLTHATPSNAQLRGEAVRNLEPSRTRRIGIAEETIAQRQLSAKEATRLKDPQLAQQRLLESSNNFHFDQPKSNPLPRYALATALLDHLGPDQLAALGSHEQAAIVELGEYARDTSTALATRAEAVPEIAAVNEAARPTDPKSDAEPPTSSDEKAELSDSFLRMTLGHERFNALSFIAAARRAEARRAAAGELFSEASPKTIH